MVSEEKATGVLKVTVNAPLALLTVVPVLWNPCEKYPALLATVTTFFADSKGGVKIGSALDPVALS
jgi:hypothetical protein